jgi:MarR family transcriptional regulator, organic hydroperoxide resistance regulator
MAARDDDGLRGGKVLEFMRLLWTLDHSLQSLSKRMATRLGVTGAQRVVLRVIGRAPRCSAGHVAAALRLDPSTLTGVLERLGDKGLIVRTRDPDDARRVQLRLTAAGERVDALRRGTVEAAVRRTLINVPSRDLATAQRVLGRLRQELDRERLGSDFDPWRNGSPDGKKRGIRRRPSRSKRQSARRRKSAHVAAAHGA